MADHDAPSRLGAPSPARKLHGRDSVLDQLRASVVDAAAGRGRLAVVAGEAGIGKTRLCEEAAAFAVARGCGVHWAACAEFAGHPAYSPWSQFLAQLGLSFPAADSSLDPTRDAEAARLAVFESVVERLRGASASVPQVLVLDDLQWADDASLRLLAYAGPVLRTLPVLMLVTRRDDGSDRPQLRDVERQAVVVRLGGLTREALRALVSDSTDRPVSERTAAAVHALTAGNPLFALELSAQLVADDALESFADSDLREVPRTVRAIQAARLDHLAPACRDALELAAVIGAEFDLVLLRDVLGVDTTGLLALVDEAAAAGLVREAAVGRWTFTHPLLAAALYEELGVARRVRAHERVGLALEAAGVRRDVSALAHHFLAALPAGTAPRAVGYCAEAAAEAMSALAYADAARLYEGALEAHVLAPHAGDRIALLLALAEARAADGLPSSRQVLLEAARCAREEQRPEALAAVALGLAGGRGFEVGLFDDTQIRLLEEALASLPGGALSLRSLCSSRLSVALSMADAEERRVELSEAAVDLARRAEDPGALAHALAAACDVRAGPAWTAYRLGAADEIIATAHASGDWYAELLGRRLRLVALLEKGELVEAEAETSRFARAADHLGQAVHQWYVPLWRSMLAAARGDLHEARALADDADRIGARAHSANAEILVLGLRFFLCRDEGDAEALADTFGRMLVNATAVDLGVMAAGTIALGKVMTGHPDEATAVLSRIADELRGLPEDSEWLPLLVQVAEAVAELGGHPIADWLHDTLARYADDWAVEGIGAYVHGSVSRHVGMLAALLGRPDDARRRFEAALDANRGSGARLLVARALWDGGVALGDRDWIRQALAQYRDLGLTRRADQLEESLAEEPPRPGPRHASASASPTVLQEGDVWLVEFDGMVAHVRDSKGVRDLARLLGAPGQEIAALDLARGPAPAPGPAPEGLAVQGDLGEVVDARARSAYKARLAAIQVELDEADADGDADRSESLVSERDALLAQLSAAYGLRRRPRRAGDPAERARTAVTARVRDAIRRIEKVHPALGRHLSRSVRTGTFCVYDP